ncbi:MAG TPA: hypothetical protein VFB62_27770 [Polyangiaceae bacterium]|nr:hypothetical protein [Polyangiaceae bacterium]
MKNFWYSILLAAACGGTAVVDGGQGGSSNNSSSRSTSTSGANTTTGPGGCDAHSDCPSGVCVFSTGTCSTACEGFCGICEVGSICHPCGTSSCPECTDCKPACVPISAGQCDDLNPCPIGQVCLFEMQQCTPSCSPQNPSCQAPLMCSMCATGSCCGCDDCVTACE